MTPLAYFGFPSYTVEPYISSIIRKDICINIMCGIFKKNLWYDRN